MKRLLIIVAGLLLGGAVVNVAVAWGCVLAVDVEWTSSDYVSLRGSPETSSWVVQRIERLGTTWVYSSRLKHKGSVYASDPPPEDVIPTWGRLAEPMPSFRSSRASEKRFIEGRGIPLRSLWCERHSTSWKPLLGGVETFLGGSAGRSPVPQNPYIPRVLPLRPIWSGFLLNTLIYAVALWVLICGPFALRRFIRVRRGLCPCCRYPIGASPVCSECGKPLPTRCGFPAGPPHDVTAPGGSPSR